MLRIKQFILSHKNGSSALVLFLASLVMIGISGGDDVFSFRGFGTGALNTLQLGVSNVAGFFSDTVNSIDELRILKTEYQELQDQLLNYQSIERDIIELRRENSSLRELLSLSNSITRLHVNAKVIARDPTSIFSTVVINKGSIHGVVRESAVIAYQGGMQGLVGKVVEVDRYTSKIMPILDPASYVAVRTQQTRHEGLAQGLGRNIFIQYVEDKAKDNLRSGDLFITSGTSSIYPPGIYVARIISVTAPDWLPSLEIEADPVIDFSRLEYVFVLIKEE